MSCRLFITKRLPEPMMTLCQLAITLSDILIKTQNLAITVTVDAIAPNGTRQSACTLVTIISIISHPAFPELSLISYIFVTRWRHSKCTMRPLGIWGTSHVDLLWCYLICGMSLTMSLAGSSGGRMMRSITWTTPLKASWSGLTIFASFTLNF